MLLEPKDVNHSQMVTQNGHTLLSWAAENRHMGVVKTLLEREDINPDQGDAFYGRAPPSWAAESGNVGVVKMLLECEDVNPNQADIYFGRAPLSWAAESGHTGVVKMLLERRDANLGQGDTKYGRTTLSGAANPGHEEAVKMVIAQKDARTAMSDNVNRTPPPLALSEEHYGAVTVPLGRGNVNCPTTHRDAPASLPPSTVHPNESMVEMQFRSPNPYTDTIGSKGQPALSVRSRPGPP